MGGYGEYQLAIDMELDIFTHPNLLLMKKHEKNIISGY